MIGIENIYGNALKSRTIVFDGNIFLIPFSIVVNCLYQNSNAKSIKMAEIEVANTQLPVCFETVFLCFLNNVHFAYLRF